MSVKDKLGQFIYDPKFKEMYQEQYRQAGEEHRLEDRNTWQTFAIILSLNGALFHFSDNGNYPLIAIFGIISSLSGVLIIDRTSLYQKERVKVLMQIQEITTKIPLYHLDIPIINEDDRIIKICGKKVQEISTTIINWGARKVMKRVLLLFAIMWIFILLF